MHVPKNSVLYRLSLWISQVSRHLGITEKSNERTGTSTVRLRDMHMAKLMSSGALETKQEKKGQNPVLLERVGRAKHENQINSTRKMD